MRISDLGRPTFLNTLTSLDPREPLTWLIVLLALAAVTAVIAFLALPQLEDQQRLVLAVALFAIIWAETYLMQRYQRRS